jgi:hypothetical protein
VRADSPGHHRSQTLSGVLGENLKNPQGPAVVRPIRHEVRRPDVMAGRRPQPEVRPLGPPESGSRRLLRGHVEAFFTPNRIHASSPHIPPRASYEIRHRAVAVPPVRVGQGEESLAQPRAIGTAAARTERRTGTGRLPDTPGAPTHGAR